MLGACLVVGLRGTVGISEMCLDLNSNREQGSTPKQQEPQPAVGGRTHLMLINCTFHSFMRNENMPKTEKETRLSKTTSCGGHLCKYCKASWLNSVLEFLQWDLKKRLSLVLHWVAELSLTGAAEIYIGNHFPVATGFAFIQCVYSLNQILQNGYKSMEV